MLTEFVGGSDLIRADLVYDGGEVVHIPPQLGTPRGDQMQGTPAEQLCELAGRTCYDSLGKGRPSFTKNSTIRKCDGVEIEFFEVTEGYHDHIAKVGHGSVWEHFNFTVELPSGGSEFHGGLLNRPGVYANIDGNRIRLTLNLRALVEWDKFSRDGTWKDEIGWIIARDAGEEVAPCIVKTPPYPNNGEPPDCCANVVEPIDDEERWVSLFISGSRGLSHELVRHKFRTAVSQRSTRFVDESQSDFVQHPLISAFLDSEEDGEWKTATPAEDEARKQYRSCVSLLEPYLAGRGVDKTSARKQARGAARGYLGNALYTELIFSASVAQWKRILRQRASVFADAEIREMACKALLTLKHCRYADCFANWWLDKSPDGIGLIAREEK